ncbi:exopolysaccharide production protein ExoZ [Microdochium nivale]|nr:exopolysaccharide production protein ExoZ [Microdochium nivale]
MAGLGSALRSAMPWKIRDDDRSATLPLTGCSSRDSFDHDNDGNYHDDSQDNDEPKDKDLEQFDDGTRHSKKHRRFGCSSPSTRKWLSILLPFFIAAPLGLTDRKIPATHATTYLNGIRGLACWAVLNHHLTMRQDAPWIFRPWGASEADYHFWQLPWLRAVHAGKGMVCVFFALSGFVLAFSPVRRMNAKGPRSPAYGDDMLTSLASSTLRRAIRLFGPMLVIVVLMGCQTYLIPWAHNYDGSADSLLGHLWIIWLRIVPVLNPYRFDYTMPDPVGQTWTLGFEYRLSLILFLVLVSVSRVTTAARKSIILSVMVWAFYCDRRWDVFAFLGGALVAEMRFAPLSDDVAAILGTDRLRPHRHLVTLLGCLALVIGLAMCSMPEEAPDQAWPYSIVLPGLTPESWNGHFAEPSAAWIWYWGGIGSVVLLWGVEQLPLLQRALSITPLAYLGEISYAYYLLQWAAVQVVGWPLQLYVEKTWGWSHGPAFALFYLSSQISCIIASDYVWRAVDLPFVVLAKFVVVDCLGVGRKDAPAQSIAAGADAGHVSAMAPMMAMPVSAEDAQTVTYSHYATARSDISDDDTLTVSDRDSIAGGKSMGLAD